MTEVQYTFSKKEGVPLSARQINHLVRAVGHYGLAPDFEVPPFPSDDEILAKHLETTPIPGIRQGFMGREHFWAIGDQVGIPRRVSSRLFSMVIFPERMPGPHERSGWGVPIAASSLGLL